MMLANAFIFLAHKRKPCPPRPLALRQRRRLHRSARGRERTPGCSGGAAAAGHSAGAAAVGGRPGGAVAESCLGLARPKAQASQPGPGASAAVGERGELSRGR